MPRAESAQRRRHMNTDLNAERNCRFRLHAGGDVGGYVDWEHPVESPALRRREPVSVTLEVDPELVVAFDRKAAFCGMTRAGYMADPWGQRSRRRSPPPPSSVLSDHS